MATPHARSCFKNHNLLPARGMADVDYILLKGEFSWPSIKRKRKSILK